MTKFEWQLLGNQEISIYYGIGDPTDQEQARFIVDTLSQDDLFDKGKLISFSIVYTVDNDPQFISECTHLLERSIRKKLAKKRRALFIPNLVHEPIFDKRKFLQEFSDKLQAELHKRHDLAVCPKTLQ